LITAGVFSEISHAASTSTAIGSAHLAGLPPNKAHLRHNKTARPYMMMP
jgi:hypothetical protein